VISIGQYAFENSSFTGTIVIPATIKTMGTHAFGQCKGIETLEIAAGGITTIPEFAFSGSSLQEVNLPEGLRVIGLGAFESCTELEGIQFPNSITQIETYAFRGSGLTGTLVLPASLKILGSYLSWGQTTSMAYVGETFTGCSINTLVIPSNLVIYNESFIENPITHIIIGENVTLRGGKYYPPDGEGYGFSGYNGGVTLGMYNFAAFYFDIEGGWWSYIEYRPKEQNLPGTYEYQLTGTGWIYPEDEEPYEGEIWEWVLVEPWVAP
jgi:hypothetical protein